jgi:hypothetical protein
MLRIGRDLGGRSGSHEHPAGANTPMRNIKSGIKPRKTRRRIAVIAPSAGHVRSEIERPSMLGRWRAGHSLTANDALTRARGIRHPMRHLRRLVATARTCTGPRQPSPCCLVSCASPRPSTEGAASLRARLQTSRTRFGATKAWHLAAPLVEERLRERHALTSFGRAACTPDVPEQSMYTPRADAGGGRPAERGAEGA